MTNSKRLFTKAYNLISGGVNSPVRAFRHVGGTPLFIKSAKGSRIKDADNNEYVDFCQSWGPLILGHSHPQVIESVIAATEYGLSYGACHEKEIEIAELLLSALKNFERVRLVSSGTEAVMTALRIARGVTKRNLIVKFEGGYHGHFDGMLVKAGSGLATLGIANSAGIPEKIAQTTIVADFNDENMIEEIFKKNGNDIAAVIIEPLPANNGLLVQRKEFLQFLRNIARQYGSLLIFDEVISGFRLHFGGYYQKINIIPDLVTLGKIIGGGMPVGAVAGMAKEMEYLSPSGSVYQAGTLSGNPISLSAGIATLEILKDPSVYQKLDDLASYFVDVLDKSDVDFAKARHMGSMVWPYFNNTKFPTQPGEIKNISIERYKKIYWELIKSGYYLPPSSLEVFFMSIAHTREEVVGLANCIIDNLRRLN